MHRGHAGERGARPFRWSQRRAYAAVDLGTNNCRLLVARPARRGFRVIDSFSRIVRLGEGRAATGELSTQAMDRCLEALEVCAEKIYRHCVERVRSVGTEACRQALNGDAFIARAEAATGLGLEVVSPREETRLALAGCAPLLDRAVPRALVIDIGGGSTELMWLRLEHRQDPQLVGIMSLPFGVVTMVGRYNAAATTPEAFAAMMTEVDQPLTDFDSIHRIRDEIAAGNVQMLGTSGTVTTLAGIHLDLQAYDRQRIDGLTLSFEAAMEACHRLLAMSPDEREVPPCIGPDRAEFVLAGCAIFEAVLLAWPVDRLVVADRGLREGILLNMMRENRTQRGYLARPRGGAGARIRTPSGPPDIHST